MIVHQHIGTLVIRILQRILFAFFISLLGSAGYACTCIDYGVPSCKLFDNADAVFIGTIERIGSSDDKDASVSLKGVNSISHRGAGMLAVRFSVEKPFKGIAGATVTALTYSGTSCDLEVKEGQRWLIFATKDEKTGQLGFGACGGNRPIGKDDALTKELAALADKSGGPTIRGRISLNQYDGVSGATVSLKGNGTNLKTTSDESGSFVFQVPNEGIYSVKLSIPFSASLLFSSPNLPPRFKAEEPTEIASVFVYDAVAKRGTCDYQYFDAFKIDLTATASIFGKFVYSDWKSFRKFYPQICRLKPTEKETLESCDLSLDNLKSDGTFSFDGLREVRYTIVVGKDLPNGPEPFYRHYYPGVRDFSKSKAIEIKQGEKRRGIRYSLPSQLPTRVVHGQIFASNGRPAILKNADGRYFYLTAYFYHELEEPKLFFQHSYLDEWRPGAESRQVEMINTKPNGTFDLELFDGFTYILKIESGQLFDKRDCGLTRIDVNESLKSPVRIILDRERPCDVVKFATDFDPSKR
ncbi:MAG: hypothetical protein ACRD6X_08155 [Pyrinomonadaceae bacterium]